MGLKKKVKKAKKKAKKTTKKVVEETKKGIKKVGDFNLSKKMDQLAQDAKNKLKELGDDFEEAIKDLGMKKILIELAKQAVKDNKKVLDTMVEVGKRIEKQPNMRDDIQRIVDKQAKGQLDFKEVQDLKKKVGLEDFF